MIKNQVLEIKYSSFKKAYIYAGSYTTTAARSGCYLCLINNDLCIIRNTAKYS